MNKVVLIGRLTRDPELRYTPNGSAVCTFTIAVDRPFTSQSGEREADFIEIVVWNKTAENVSKYMSKGRQIAVDGRLQIRQYEGNDGQRRWRAEVIANTVEFLGSGNGGSNGGQSGYANSSSSAPRVEEPTFNSPSGFSSNTPGAEVNFSDSDLPF